METCPLILFSGIFDDEEEITNVGIALLSLLSHEI